MLNPFRFLILLPLLAAILNSVSAQTSGSAPTTLSDGKFSPEQLDQLVAPIALYPDDLLAQVLMASTYPLEVVQASRWRNSNPKISGTELDTAMAAQPWDPSVKSLVAFPEALKMLDGNLDWAQDLGNVVLAQQQDVMTAVQRMRAQAQSAGNLQTTTQQKVIVEKETIIIQPAVPEKVYVPVYSPVTVYGTAWAPPTWYYPWHAYPSSYWYWGYPVARAVSFTAGFVTGALIFGGCNWGARSFYCRPAAYGHAWYRGSANVNINVNRNVNWNHNPAHRHGVSYHTTTVTNRYGRYNNVNVDNRPGWGNSNTIGNINRPSTLPAQRPDVNRPSTLPAQRPDVNRPSTLPAQRPDVNRPSTLPAQRPDVNRPSSKPSQRPSGGGLGGSGSAAKDRAASARGAHSSSGGSRPSYSAPSHSKPSKSSSRSAPSRSAPSRSAPSRSGGGGRGGGGRR